MKKYIFSEKVGKKTTKYEIIAETLEEAQTQLSEKLEGERNIPIVGVGLPDYIEPISAPTDALPKTFNITYRPDPDNYDETKTITYEAFTMAGAQAKFLEDFPEQANQYRETHSPLANYEVDRKNAESTVKETEIEKPNGLFDRLFANATVWVKLFTALLIGLIGLGLVSSALFGIDGGFGIVTNISNLLSNFQGLTGLVVLFLVYFLFIRSGEEKDS